MRWTATPAPAGRVCILTETFHPVRGGGESQARALAAGLVRRRWSVLVLTRRSDPAFPAREELDGARVRRLPPTGASRGSKWALLATAFVALLQHRMEYDTILVSGFRILGVAAVAAALILGKGCVLKADSLGEMSGAYFAPGLAGWGLTTSSFPFPLLLALRNRLLLRADGFVAVSTPVVEELLGSSVPAARIARVPNSVDTERFRPAREAEKRVLRERLGIPLDAVAAVYTGRLVTYKGLPDLVEAWGRLARRYPEAHLVLVGSGGLDMHACEGQLREEVRGGGMAAAVTFCGAVEDVSPYLRASDLFVFPTENEAFGISVIEAMASGLPVASTRAGGLDDIVEDGVDALTFGVADPVGLARVLERLVADADLRKQLGEAGRRKVVEAYSESAVVERYALLLDAAAAGAGVSPASGTTHG